MRNLTKLAGMACATTLLTWGAQADLVAEEGLGFTDLRVGGALLPTGSIGGGKYFYRTGDFEDGVRVSLTLIGPICNLTPVGCGTSPNLRRDKDAEAGAYGAGEYITGIEGDTYNFESEGSYTYDLLFGIEVSNNNWSRGGEGSIWGTIYGPFFEDPMLMMLVGPPALAAPLDLATFLTLAPGLGQPAVDLNAKAITLHFGWGFEIDTRFRGAWHVEVLGSVGGGLATVDWTDPTTGAQDDDDGFYMEVGAQIGTYYTHPFGLEGLQVGVFGGAKYQKASVQAFDRKTDLSVSGASIGGSIGYRF